MAEHIDLIDRERGILTQGDKEFLVNGPDDDLTDNARNVRYHEMRKRIENAIYDFYILAQYLPTKHIQQIFEPAYDWGRERRQLDEQGRTQTRAEWPFQLSALRSMIEFYCRGMFAGGMAQTTVLMKELIEEGIKNGLRENLLWSRTIYQNAQVSLNIEYTDQYLWQDYLAHLKKQLPSDVKEAMEIIKHWQRQRLIGYQDARYLLSTFIEMPDNG